MDIRVNAHDGQFSELIARLKGAGKKARATMNTSMRRGSKPIVTDWKREAGNHKRTGAMMRSFGTYTRRDSVVIGVRYNWQDNKTGKIPNKYAAAANAKQGDWFGRIWGYHKQQLTGGIFRELKIQLDKKGF